MQFPEHKKANIATHSRPVRAWLLTAILAVIVAGFVAFNFRDISLLADGGRALAAFFFVQPLVVVSLVTITGRLVVISGRTITFGTMLEAVCIAQATQQLLPSRLSEAVKPLYLKSRGLPLARGIVMVLLERFFDVVCVCLLLLWLSAFAAVTMFPALSESAPFLWVACGLGLAGIMVIVFAPKFALRLILRLPFFGVRSMATQLFSSARRSVTPRRLAGAAVLSVAAWANAVAQFIVFFHIAGSIPLAPIQWVVVFTAATLGLAVAVAPGGLGTFEAAIVTVMHGYGYSFTESMLLAVGFRLASNAIPTLVTAWLAASGKIQFRELLRQLRGRNRDEPERQ